MDIEAGNVLVGTSDNGPLSVDFYAEKLCQKIIHVSEDAPEEIKAPAYEFRAQVKKAICDIIAEAIESDRLYRSGEPK
jgi:hypothetical protein